MNVKEFASVYAEEQGITKKEAEKVVLQVIDCMCSCVEESGEIRFPDRFTLSISVRAARQGRNPKTGDTIEVPAKRTLKIKVSKKLSEFLNQ